MTGFTNWHRLSVNWNEVWSMNNSGTGGLVDVKKDCPSYLNIESRDNLCKRFNYDEIDFTSNALKKGVEEAMQVINS